MRVLYSLSVILLIGCFLLAKKSDKKLNILKWVLISIVVFSGFNAFSAFLVSIVHIKASLLSRFFINILTSCAIWYYSLRNKNLQKYYFDWKDIVALIIITMISTVIINTRTHGFDLYFETTDPAAHMLSTERFLQTDRTSVDIKQQDKLYNTQKTYDLFYSYVNFGTMIQVFGNSPSSHVTIFYVFEYFVLISSVFALYLAIVSKTKKITKCIISLVIAIIYMLGYPLNNLIFGFHYLGLAMLVTNIIVLIYEELFDTEEKNNLFMLIAAFLLNFSVFTSYYLFIPVVYGGAGMFIMWKAIINKEIKLKKAIYIVAITLVIPFALGMYMFFIYPRLALHSSGSGVSAFSANGYIYRNLMGNFLILFPIVIYYFISCVKNKKIEVETFMLPILLIFMAYIMKLMYARVAETYYYYKFYFMLSLLMYLSIGKLFNKDKKFSGLIGSYVVTYAILIIAMFFNVDTQLAEKYILINPVPSIDNVVHIYKANKNYVYDSVPIYTKSELKSLDKIDDLKLLKTGNVYYFGGLLQKLWLYSLYNVSSVLDEYRLGAYYDENPTLDEVFDDSDVEYVLVPYSSKVNKQIAKLNSDENSNMKLNVKYKDKNFILYNIVSYE